MYVALKNMKNHSFLFNFDVFGAQKHEQTLIILMLMHLALKKHETIDFLLIFTLQDAPLLSGSPQTGSSAVSKIMSEK